jgi:HEPN domain-containing protein
MKQTAVEWLVDNLHYLHSTKWDDIVEQAKEMEKEHIMDAYNNCELCNPEDYYNETFNTKER